MDYPVYDQIFLAKVEQLIETEGEVLVLFRYARAAGSKDFMFFKHLDVLQAKLGALPANTNVIVYGDRQLPLRGHVDSTFIQRAIEMIPEDSEFLIVCLERTVHDYRPHQYWESCDDAAGETHVELVAELEGLRGRSVAVGAWPPWPGDSQNVFEGYVPGDGGVISPGPY